VVLAAAIGCLLVFFAGLALMPDVLGWTALWMAGGAVGVIAWRAPELRGPLLLGFVLRVACTLVQSYGMPLPGTGADTTTFEEFGWAWGRNGIGEVWDRFTVGAYLYSWVIAVFYAILGRSPLMIQALNVFLGTLVVRNAFALARVLWGTEPARRAAWAVALFPTGVLFSAIILREQVVVFPLTLGMLWFTRWYTTGRVRPLLGALLAFCLAALFHEFVIGILAAAVVVFTVRWGTGVLRAPGSNVLPNLIGFVALLAAGIVGLVAVSAKVDSLGGNTGDALRFYNEYQSSSRAGYLDNLRFDSPWDLLWQPPIRVIFFLLMPFPWLVTSVYDLLGVLDSLLYVCVLLCLIRAAPRIRRNGAAAAVLFLASASVVVLSLAVSNYGTAIRHRAKIAPILIAVAAAGMVRPQRADAASSDHSSGAERGP
jgi:hypothetical protein